LREEGFSDITVFERGLDVGGVWRDNTYPGCACDVQSHLYCFSFAPNPGWSRVYSPQPEIQAYLRGCAERFGVIPHIRFGVEMRGAVWDSAGRRWRLETAGGPFYADALVMAIGGLSEPELPKLPGIENFSGPKFHSARWDHTFDLRGKRVAVVGTGASAIQIVPAIAPDVAHLSIFQRTAPWIIPRLDKPIPEATRAKLARSPWARWWARTALFVQRELMWLSLQVALFRRLTTYLVLRNLEKIVPDPQLRSKITPNYAFGCKRVLVSDDYLPALMRDNVELVTDSIAAVRARSIVTGDGREHAVDAIVYGTGFNVAEPAFAVAVRGRDGRTLAEVWGSSPRAHAGITVAGFPNLFLMSGPNSGLGHSSVILMIESQIEHLVSALDFMRRNGVAAIEPRPSAQAAFVADVDRKMQRSVWTTGGCKSWYLDRGGRNFALWPGLTFTFRWRARFRPREYVMEVPAHGELPRSVPVPTS
jgi:cation diffusion facilitator CzcD-associated flavoprotein CzcO